MIRCDPTLEPVRRVVTLDAEIVRRLLEEVTSFQGAAVSGRVLKYLALMESGQWDAKPRHEGHEIQLQAHALPLLVNGTHRMMAIACSSVPVATEMTAPPEVFTRIEEIRAEIAAE